MNNTVPKVSILIAVFNGSTTFDKCLESIVKQTYNHIELIIMDGGSTDGTQDILKKYSSHITYWESCKDNGIYHAWNKALRHCTGDWICFIGADDFFSNSEVIQNAMKYSHEEYLLISGLVNLVDSSGNIKRIIGSPWNWSLLKKFHNIPHPGLLHHKSLFIKYGHFNEKYKIAGDYEFLLRLEKNIKCKFIKESFVDMGMGGASKLQLNKVFKETFEIQRAHPQIGIYSALKNYTMAKLKAYGRKILNKQLLIL